MDISSGLLQRAFDHKGEINKIVVVLTSRQALFLFAPTYQSSLLAHAYIRFFGKPVPHGERIFSPEILLC
jgi:hypothetical protein